MEAGSHFSNPQQWSEEAAKLWVGLGAALGIGFTFLGVGGDLMICLIALLSCFRNELSCTVEAFFSLRFRPGYQGAG